MEKFRNNFQALLFLSGCTLIRLLGQEKVVEETTLPGSSSSGKPSRVPWSRILSSSLTLLSLACLACTSASWYWYSPSLQPFLSTNFNFSEAKTGLVFMSGAVSYTVSTPLLGILMDRGLMKEEAIILVGNLVLVASYLLLGPLPPLARVLPSSPAWTIASVALQGLATGAAYLGSFCLMLREAPDTEQAQGMVSSLYVMGDCAGAYLGSALGGLVR